MRMFVYSIYDNASQAYMRPFFMQSDGQAIRAFGDLATQADHEIGKHPKDYSLFRIGTFDDNKGKLDPESPSGIVTAMEMVATSQKIEPGSLTDINIMQGKN